MARLLSVPKTPSAAMLLAYSYAIALVTQGALRPLGLILASLSLALAELTYEWLSSALASRSPRRAAIGLAVNAAPYVAAGSALPLELAAPALLAVAAHAALAARRGPRDPAAIAAGSAALSLTVLPFAGLMERPTVGTAVASAAFLSFSLHGVAYVEGRLSTRRVSPIWALVALAPGLAAAAACWPPCALAFAEPLIASIRGLRQPKVEPRRIREVGVALAVRSALFVSLLVILLALARA